MPTFPNQEVMLLNFDLYFDVLESKGVKIIRMRRTQTFENLSGADIFVLAEHVWSYGDTLAKLAYRYYGSYQYWWVIAFVNKKPTDSHYTIGDELIIPEAPETIEALIRL